MVGSLVALVLWMLGIKNLSSGPKQKTEAYQVNPQNFESTATKVDEALVNEAIAYYQTASRDYKAGALKLKPLK